MPRKAFRRQKSRKQLGAAPVPGAFAHLPPHVQGLGRRSVAAGLKFGASSLALGVLTSALAPVVARAQEAAPAPAPNINIVADGRTRTNVTVAGSTASITTATVSNQTGFNTFSSFQQGAGSTVNLYVPDGASNLVNIVRGGSVMIDGVLNSYKDGQIGGNVYFSDSQGFIVGQNGVVNVGSLTVNTPTDSFLDGVVGPNGSVNDAQAGRLMSGQIPLSADGFITISGQINAQDGITLQGQGVTVNGPQTTGKDLTQRQRFNATVNSQGMTEGAQMVSRNGVISIVAAGNAHVGGRLRSGGASGGGGRISVQSGGKTTIAPTAILDVDGTAGPGGAIVVKAHDTLDAKSGALLTARGTKGPGGFIELSGGVVNLGALNIDLGSDTGKAGALLIDPAQITVNDGTTYVTGGASVSLVADNTITVTGTGRIDTTSTTGAAGDISLTAPEITLQDGAVVTANDGVNAAGTVTFTATEANGGTAQINIGAATVSGGDVNLLASATAAPLTLIASTPTATASVSMTNSNITATGKLTATATATTSASAVPLPIGVVVTNVSATVDVLGTTQITADSAELAASATASNLINTQSLVPANSTADGAVAVSTVNSTAATHVGDSAGLTVTNDLALSAENTVTSHANATPSTATFGASVAVSVVDATTTATVDGAASIQAGSLDIGASTVNDIVATAAATAGGASSSGPASGSKAAEYLSDPKYTSAESTSEGSVSVVGALAISDLTSTTTASMSSTTAATVGGDLQLHTDSGNAAAVTADGSAVQSNVGVGVAVGINLAKVVNAATLGQDVTADAVTVSAKLPEAPATVTADDFTTTATSGAGGTSVGVAGSLAVNLIDVQNAASIASGTTTINGTGDVTLESEGETTSEASATPSTGGVSGDVGVGASVAINIVANRTTASVADGAGITGAGAIELSAKATHEITTEAETGATGGIAITPALALSLVTNTTSAQLGTLTGTQEAESISISAAQHATETTKASGEAAGDKAAIGAAVAVALVDDTASATTLRNLDAANDITIEAGGASLNTLTAKASASGGEAADSSGEAKTGQDSSVDATVTKNLTDATQKQQDAGVGDGEQQGAASDAAANEDGHSASTSEGKVTVAAAVGVNIQNATVSAGIPDSVDVTSGGKLTVGTAANTTGSVSADGSAVGEAGSAPAAVGIGAAVAVNVVHAKNDATIGTGTVHAAEIDVSALKLDVAVLMAGGTADPVSDTYLASAKSGAGGSSVGIAGSVAINLVDTESVATIAAGGNVTLTGGTGAVSLSTDDRTDTTASALPDETGASGGKVGIGASVAINILGNRSTAAVGNGTDLNGAGDITLSATATHAITTEAEAGSEGGISITPVLALSLVTNTTSAKLGTSSVAQQGATVSLQAAQHATETTSAKGQAAGGTAAIGAAVAVALVDDSVSATTLRNLDVSGDVTIQAGGASLNTLTAEASASGGKAADSSGEAQPGQDSSVDQTVTKSLSAATQKQADSGVGDSEQQTASTDAAGNESGRSASTSEGKVTVAAAVGVNVQNATVTAGVPDGVGITAGGTLTVATAANTTGSVSADGSAVGEEGAQAQVGIGAAVAVNVVHAKNDATIGTGAVQAGKIDVTASKLDVAVLMAGGTADPVSDIYLASAKSGAGGSSVGIAGSLALNMVDTEGLATIAAGGSVALSGGSGAVSLSADNRTETTAKALPDETGASGGKVGIGASVAINILGNRADASVGNGTDLAGAGDITLMATATHAITTEAEAGSKGGYAITPVVSLALVNNTTSAQLGTLPAVQGATGAVSITAIQQASETTSAKGQAAGGTAAIGAAVAINLVNDTATATTLRSLSAGGDVTIRAMGASLGDLTAEASAAGAAEADTSGDAPAGEDATVNDKVDKQLTDATQKQTDGNVGTSEQKTATSDAASQNHSAETSQGKISVAAAVGVNIQNATVTAGVPDGVDITSPTGVLTIATASNTDGKITTKADAVGTEGSQTQIGIGAAVSVNVVHAKNDATLGTATHDVQALTIDASKLDVAAYVADDTSTATRKDSFLASATSGGGGTKVGVAGALGLNLVDTESMATIADDAEVTLHSGNVSITSAAQTSEVAKALPVEGTTGGQVGIGASVAINIVGNRSVARIGENVVLDDADEITLKATADHEIETEAEAGAAGGVSIVPVLALTLATNTTAATIGASADTLNLNGALEVEAEQGVTETTNASADATGGKTASVGAALSLALITDTVSVTTDRSIHALGDVSFKASGTSTGSLTVKASAEGAKGADSSDKATDGGGDSVDSKVDNQLAFGKSTQTSSGVGDSEQQAGTEATSGQDHSAKSSEGKVSVAAAVGVNVTSNTVTAILPDGKNISAGGRLTVAAVNGTDGTVTADASATESQISIGAAAAVNAVTEVNTASLGAATYTAEGVTVTALKGTPPDAPHVDTFSTAATSGAGGSKVGIAGALALNLIHASSTATISGSATVDAGGDTVVIGADQRMTASASATPKDDSDVTGGKVAIGASVALNLITTTANAEVMDGAGLSNGAGISVSAVSDISTETEAKAGSEGGIAIDAVVALALLDETTTARIGTGAATTTAGNVSITATNTGENKATGTGEAKAGKVGVGAAVAVISGNGAQDTDLKNTSVTSATLARDLTADALTISATSARSYEAYATASAGGGKDKEPSETSNASSTQTLGETENYQKGTDGSSQETGNGGSKVTVAAAVGVAVAQDMVTASLGDVTVNLTGDLNVNAGNDTNLASKGDGRASGANIGVAVGVGLSISNNVASASIADGATVASAGAINVTADTSQNMGQEPGKTDFRNGLGAVAFAGASSKKVSVAGALAVDVSNTTTSATIGDNVNIGNVSRVGDVTVSADNTSRMSAKATSVSTTSGNVGIGASVAVIVSDNNYTANVGAGTNITSDALSVTATNEKIPPGVTFNFTDLKNFQENIVNQPLFGAGNYYTEAIGGAAAASGTVAVEGSFAVMVFNDSASAAVGKSLASTPVIATTTVNTAGGDVTVAAKNEFDAKALSGAVSLSGKVGVGVSSSVIVSHGHTTAELADSTHLVSAGAVGVTADASQSFDVVGISASGGGNVGVAGVATVLVSGNTVQALMGQGVQVGAAGDVSLDATNDFDALSVAGGLGVGGSAGVGAAASVLTVENVTRAAMADGTSAGTGVTVSEGGALDIGAHATETAKTFAVAGGAAGTAGVGAGAGVYVIDTTTEALMGNYARIGQGSSVGDITIAATDDSTLDTFPGAAGVGGSVGAGAGVGVGVLTKTVSASIGDDAFVTANNVEVNARSGEAINVIAISAGVGGSAGLAGAVAVYTVTDTTTASIGHNASVLATDDVAVLANDFATLDALAGSLGAGGSAGVGASAGIVIIDNTTHASIADGAAVTALGFGSGTSYVSDFTVSFGSIADNFQGADLPDWDSSTGISAGNASATSDVGLTAAAARDTGLALLTKSRSSAAQTQTGHGVIVNAAGKTSVRSLEIGFGGGGSVGVALSANVPILSSDTRATIGAALINKMTGTPATAQGVTVAAANDTYDMGIAGAAAVGGAAGAGAGVSVAVVNTTTMATVDSGANMAAKGNVNVTARAQSDFVTFDAALGGGGTVGLAGGVGVISMTDTTTAELAGTTVAGGNVQVLADDQTRIASMDGAVAIGFGAAGIGGAVSVVSLTKTTTADIAASANVTALGTGSGNTFNAYDGSSMTSASAVRGINVAATSGESTLTLAASAAGGLYAGISGVVTVQLQNITTLASIGDNAQINQDASQSGANGGQDVVVTARDTNITSVYAGGLAVGFAGIAGTVDVGVIKTTTGASIGDGATLDAKNDVLVSGLSNKAGNSVIVSGAGGVVGVAAAVAIYDYGNGITPGGTADDKLGDASDGQNNMSDVTKQASDQTKDSDGNGVSSLFTGPDTDPRIASASSQAQTARQGVSLDPANVGLGVPAGTSANMGSAHISAGGTLALRSRDDLNTDFTAGAVGVGIAGIGAGIVVQSVDTTNTAQMSGAAQVNAASLDMLAMTSHTLKTTTGVGAAGGFGLAAAVSVVSDDSDTYAYINGATITLTGGTAAVNADSTRSLTTKAYGVSVGIIGAAGVSWAEGDIGGNTKAAMGADATGHDPALGMSIGDSSHRAASVSLGASGTASTTSDTIAAGGGIGVALQGAVAMASIDGAVSTAMHAAHIYTTGAITSAAQISNTTGTTSGGAALAGGLAAGVSVSHSSGFTDVSTTVDGGSILDGGSIWISAKVLNNNNSAVAEAVAGALVGVAGSDAASNSGVTAITTVSDSGINATGAVNINSEVSTSQDSDASGFVGGVVAVGSNNASSASGSTTRAAMIDMSGVKAGSLNITATGTDSNTSSSTAGSGGVVAGAASKAVTSNTSTTEAYADTTSPSAKYLIDVGNGLMDVNATYTAVFGGTVDSTQASLVGASGAQLVHGVGATVSAYLGDDAYVRAASLSVVAHNLVHNFFVGETPFDLFPGGTAASAFDVNNAGWNVDSGSGGLVNLPAGSSTATITQSTQANIGANADIRLMLPTSGTSALTLEAYNETIAHQKAKLDSGGLVATAAASVAMNAIQNATVNIGDNGNIVVDLGDIYIAAWGNADMDGRAAATTYGVAGAPSGNADAVMTANNAVAIGQNVRIEATNGLDPMDGITPPTNGTINIFAGDGPDGTAAVYRLATTLDLFNNAAIPISGTPDPKSILVDNAHVTQGTTTPGGPPLIGIVAAGDITIAADRGTTTLSALGTGKDIYREAAAKLASAVSNAFGGDDVSFDYHGGTVSSTGSTFLTLNGLVATGLQRFKSLTIDYVGGCDPHLTTCYSLTGNIDYQQPTTVSPDNSIILQRLAQLEILMEQAKGDTVALGAYRNEITFLHHKLVAMGLGDFNGPNGAFELTPYLTGSSEYDLLQQQINTQQGILTNVTNVFQLEANVVNADIPSVITDIIDNGTSQDYVAYGNSVKSTITTLHNFTSIYSQPPTIDDGHGHQIPNPAYNASFINTYNGIGGKLNTANTYRTAINSLKNTNASLQTQVNAQIAIINDAASSTSDVNNAKAQMVSLLDDIATNNASIQTNADSLTTLMNGLNSDLTYLVNTAKTSADNSTVNNLNYAPTSTSDSGGALWAMGNAKTAVSTLSTGFSTYKSSVSDTIGVLKGISPTPVNAYSIDSFASTTANILGIIKDAQDAQATASTTPASAPTTVLITLDDIAARLGNITLRGGVVTGGGTGILSAPGDAKIQVDNNTAASVKLNNMIMPSYDAGHVRVNGVMVNASADIDPLNAGNVTANFANVVTGLVSGQPQVIINSNYNPASQVFYNPLSTDPSVSTLMPSPDIVVNGNIKNPDGRVAITSQAGDIFVYGTIEAASLDILAKNGDFVSSYVNGFDHVGGDPAGFNNAVNPAEAGTGIIVNGAVSISARYLNINSTIQSGIAQWDVNIANGFKLTATDVGTIGVNSSDVQAALDTYIANLTSSASPSTVSTTAYVNGSLSGASTQSIKLDLNPTGLNQTELANAIKEYNDAIVAWSAGGQNGPAPDPLYTISDSGGQGQLINIQNYQSGTAFSPRLEFTIAQAEAYANAGHANKTYAVITSGSNIGVGYDVDHAQLVVDGTEVHGGYIQIYGQLMNTASAGGQLNVLDGFGTINVTNTTNIPLVLQTLNAGPDTTGTVGRGTEGKIDITDITHVVSPYTVTSDGSVVPNGPSQVSFTHAVYTRNYDVTTGSASIVRTLQDGMIDPVTGELDYGSNPLMTTVLTGSDAGGADARSTSFDLPDNQRYIWTTSSQNTATVAVSTTSGQLFGSSSLEITNYSTLTATGQVTKTTTRLADGTYLSQDNTPTGTTAFFNDSFGNPALAKTDTNYYSYVANSTLDQGSPTADSVVTGDFSFQTGINSHFDGSSGRDCNWWTLCIYSTVTSYYTITQDYTTIKSHSIRADFPIGINFIGSDNAAVNVTSNSNVTLRDDVTAAAGSVTIAANGGTSSIFAANPQATITGDRIKLTAAGSVGTSGQAIPVQMNRAAPTDPLVPATGALVATAAAGNVNLTAQGSVLIEKVTAAGSPLTGGGLPTGIGQVNINVGGNIRAAATSDFIDGGSVAYIQAPRVSLTSLNGEIGSIATPLMVNTGYSLDGRNFGDPVLNPGMNMNPYYGLSALAAGDIGITSGVWSSNTHGNMLLDQVVSIGGDVALSAAGQILDNNPAEAIDSRTWDQLVGFWDSLGLVRGSPENNDKINLAITAYQNGRTADYNTYWQIRMLQSDPTVYDPNFSVVIDPTSSRYKALVDQGVDPAAFAQAQTDRYHALNAEVGDLTTTYDKSFQYVAGSDEIDQLSHGGDWSERQLALSLSPGALKTITGTNPVIKAPNVSGRTVSLTAGIGIGETVNGTTSSPGVDIAADIDPSTLSPAQKIALVTAERPDLELVVSAITLPSDPTPQQQAEYDAASTLGILSTPTIVRLGLDEADMTPAELAAFNAAADGLVDASNLTIRVLSKRPLNFDATTRLDVSVTDAPGTSGTGTPDTGIAYLASRGSALLGNVSVPGNTRIKVQGSIANAGTTGIVATGDLILESAQGGIGTGIVPGSNPLSPTYFSPMRLALLPDATITARAQGSIDLDMAGTALVDTIYSPKDVTLLAADSILNANDDLLINILGTDVTLTAQNGDIKGTGPVGTALNVGVNFQGGITASAPHGEIALYGPYGHAFVIQSALAPNAISLQAADEMVLNGQVSTAGPVQLISGGLLAMTGIAQVNASVSDDITVIAGSMQMFDGATMVATGGSIGITTTTGDALVTGITSGANVTIGAAGHVLAGHDSARTDITALGTGALVKITAGEGIGDQTRTNFPQAAWPFDGVVAEGEDPIILTTDTPNPLIIKTHKIDLTAATGDIDVTTPLDVTDAALEATTGNIDITGGGSFHTQTMTSGGNASIVTPGDLVADLVHAGTGGPGTVHLETTGGALTVGTSTSTGTQTLLALNDVGFTQITTTGALPGDPGDVVITSTDGAITGGSIDAAGSVHLNGNGIQFDNIVAGIDAIFDSSKDIIGTLLQAGNNVDLTAGSDTYAGDIRIGTVIGKTMTFDATGDLTLPDVRVATSIVLRGGNVTAGITQVPSGPDPLLMTLTGGRGSVGTMANVTVDAPAGLSIDELKFIDTVLGTTARSVSIADAYVPGSLLLTTPLQVLLFDDRTPAPHYNADVQFHEPTFKFYLNLQDYYSISNAYVVQYVVSPQSANQLPVPVFDGAGLVRDTIRVMRNGEDWGTGPGSLFWLMDQVLPPGTVVYVDGQQLIIDGVPYDIGVVGGQGPAVQLGSAQ